MKSPRTSGLAIQTAEDSDITRTEPPAKRYRLVPAHGSGSEMRRDHGRISDTSDQGHRLTITTAVTELSVNVPKPDATELQISGSSSLLPAAYTSTVTRLLVVVFIAIDSMAVESAATHSRVTDEAATGPM